MKAEAKALPRGVAAALALRESFAQKRGCGSCHTVHCPGHPSRQSDEPAPQTIRLKGRKTRKSKTTTPPPQG